MGRGYQHEFSKNDAAMFETALRQKKAQTMVAVLKDMVGNGLDQMSLLNVGGSAGIIDAYLAQSFKQVVGVDIDEYAISYAQQNFNEPNLRFDLGDAMNLPYDNETFDVVICSQVYEHVPDAGQMMKEIHRVLSPGGVVYFAASNRFMFNEPHYNLPLLSVIPRPLAHVYMSLMRKGKYYYEKHFSYWGLKRLVKQFVIHDYTKRLVSEPDKFGTDYMISAGSFKQKIALFMCRFFYWFFPGYMWLLQKESDGMNESKP